MDRIEEIKLKLQENSDQQSNNRKAILKLELVNMSLRNDYKKLDLELKELEAKEQESICADEFFSKHPNMKYLGKSNGKTETAWGNIYAQCHDTYLELFEGNDGVGSYTIGVCPKCKNEISFTNYGNY